MEFEYLIYAVKADDDYQEVISALQDLGLNPRMLSHDNDICARLITYNTKDYFLTDDIFTDPHNLGELAQYVQTVYTATDEFINAVKQALGV